MSGSHHHDPIDENIETHPVKLAIGIAVGAVALVIAIIMVVQFAIGSYGSRSMKEEPSMSAAAVAKRLAPVARVEMDPNAPASPAPAAVAPAAAMPAVAMPAAPAKVASAGGSGKATYDSVCAVCHASGVAGAPMLGDKPGWAPRLKTGVDALYTASIKGKGAMPPKGGNTALSDDAVKAAVDHMLAAVK
ncbi:MAG: c-type cytochrome [Pseudomonadota bacterium]|nr:c-type cytochrome [Pseudomonadota bacterium]